MWRACTFCVPIHTCVQKEFPAFQSTLINVSVSTDQLNRNQPQFTMDNLHSGFLKGEEISFTLHPCRQFYEMGKPFYTNRPGQWFDSIKVLKTGGISLVGIAETVDWYLYCYEILTRKDATHRWKMFMKHVATQRNLGHTWHVHNCVDEFYLHIKLNSWSLMKDVK